MGIEGYFFEISESATVVPRMATIVASEASGPISNRWAASILKAAKARTAARP